MGTDRRYETLAFTDAFSAYGVLLGVVAFVGPFALAFVHLPAVAIVLAAVVPGVPAALLFLLMWRGQIAIRGQTFVQVSLLRRDEIDVGRIQRLVVRRTGWGQPWAWLDLGDREVRVRGISNMHGLDRLRLGSEPGVGPVCGCVICGERFAMMGQIARDLGVSCVELPARPRLVDWLA